MSILRYGILSQDLLPTQAIEVEFEGTPTAITDTPAEQEFWDEIVIAGQSDPVFFTIAIAYDIEITGSSSEGKIHYRINAGAWVSAVDVTETTLGTIYITNIDFNDTVDLKLYAHCVDVDELSDVSATLIGGTVTGGATGTVSAVDIVLFNILADS